MLSGASAPGMSCLFARIRSVAPARRCRRDQHPRVHKTRENEPYLLSKQIPQFFSAVFHTNRIAAVDHPDDGIGLFKVVPPVRSQGTLTAHIP